MTRTAIALATAGLLIAFWPDGARGQTDHEKALASLIEAERSFSRSSEEKGIREAFLAWLAPDAVVFRPGPVEARPVYEKMNPANPVVLTWEPEIAEVAASGELGYTSGPYQLRPLRGAEPTDFGHYVSVWKKQPDGTWKVLLDIGVPHGRPEPPSPPGIASPAASVLSPPLSPEKYRDEEYAFGVRAGSFDNEAGKKGLRKALAAFATADVRVLRAGRLPSVGARAASALIPADAGRIGRGSARRTASFRVGMAWSGDIAWSYGTIEPGEGGKPGEATVYLRLWRRVPSGDWKISLDIELAVSPS